MKSSSTRLPFEQQSTGGLIARMCIPAVIIMIVTTIYHMTDLFFIGQLNDITQLAAVSLASPLLGIQTTLGTLIGGGGCAVIARQLGENKGSEKPAATACLMLAIVSGIVCGVLTLAGMDIILPLLGASEQTAPYARQYLSVMAISAPVVVFSTSFANIIRAEGASRQSMTANLLGTVVNMILDPILILGLGMGVIGAAVATAAGNLLGAAYLVRYLMTGNSRVAPGLQTTGIAKSCLPIIALGLPTALANLLMNFAGGIQNRMLTGYGDEAIAAFSVGGKAAMIVAMVGMGIAIGIQPVLGYFWGAGNRERLMAIIRVSAITVTVCTTLLGGLCFLFGRQLTGLFVTDRSTAELALRVTRTALISAPVIGGYYLATNLLQASGYALRATVASVLRQGLILVPALVVMQLLAGLDGLIWCSVIADLFAAVAAIPMAISASRKRFGDTVEGAGYKENKVRLPG